MKKEKKYLGIIFIAMGCSYWTGKDIGKVAIDCAKCCKSDWKHLFKLPKGHIYPVNIYDYSDGQGWHCGFNGIVKCRKTNQPLKFVKTVYATV